MSVYFPGLEHQTHIKRLNIEVFWCLWTHSLSLNTSLHNELDAACLICYFPPLHLRSGVAAAYPSCLSVKGVGLMSLDKPPVYRHKLKKKKENNCCKFGPFCAAPGNHWLISRRVKRWPTFFQKHFFLGPNARPKIYRTLFLFQVIQWNRQRALIQTARWALACFGSWNGRCILPSGCWHLDMRHTFICKSPET